jgi:hypothetical protein
MLANAAVIAWVDPTELTQIERDTTGYRRILKAATAVAVFCLLVAFGPAALLHGSNDQQASLERSLTVVSAEIASGAGLSD